MLTIARPSLEYWTEVAEHITPMMGTPVRPEHFDIVPRELRQQV